MNASAKESAPRSLRNVDLALYHWLRVQALTEHKSTGEKLNEILREAKERHEYQG
jgi:plasmid stability protein